MTQTIIKYIAAAHNHTRFTDTSPSNTTPTAVFALMRRSQCACFRVTSIATHNIVMQKKDIVREPRRSVLDR
jgi:hypothetical protein